MSENAGGRMTCQDLRLSARRELVLVGEGSIGGHQ